MVIKRHTKEDRYYEYVNGNDISGKLKLEDFKKYFKKSHTKKENEKMLLAVKEDMKHYSPGFYIGVICK